MIILAGLLAAAAAPAQTRAALTITHAWARPALAGRAAGGYLWVTNAGRRSDSLIAAASPVAAKVTLHEMQMGGGVMRMRALTRLEIPPGATIRLESGGYHLMLEGLKRELRAGDSVDVSLTFARAGVRRVSLPVRASPPAMGHGHM